MLLTTSTSLPYPDLFQYLRAEVTPGFPVYLVGGAVRDLLIQKPIHDLDFVMEGNIKPLARKLADAFHGAFYMLDDERNTARVILPTPISDSVSGSLIIDFASTRGKTLLEDLQGRDFTLNAMALDITQFQQLIDPLGGAADLKNKRLKLCSPTSLSDDPLRVVRGIRLAISKSLNLVIPKETLDAMIAASPMITQVSPERQRDELFRILEGTRITTAIRLLEKVGVLPYLLPELETLKGVEQSTPHVLDVWEHTLAAVNELEILLSALSSNFNEAVVSNLTLGLAVLHLGEYRSHITEYLQETVTGERTRRGLLFLAMLYHDISKPATAQREVFPLEPDGTGSTSSKSRIRFLDHENLGSEIIRKRAKIFAFSGSEVDVLERLTQHHMRVHSLASITQKSISPTRLSGSGRVTGRAIYRFFRRSGDAGVGVCLMSLADVRATYRATLPQEVWSAELEICKDLLDAWWKTPEVVHPTKLITGDDLIRELGLTPGPKIGLLLEKLREAQAAGEINTREKALEFVKVLAATMQPV